MPVRAPKLVTDADMIALLHRRMNACYEQMQIASPRNLYGDGVAFTGPLPLFSLDPKWAYQSLGFEIKFDK